MKRNIFAIALLGFSAATAVVGTAAAALFPNLALVHVWVRKDEPSTAVIFDAGNINYTAVTGTARVQVAITDNRPGAPKQSRDAYTNSGATTLLQTSNANVGPYTPSTPIVINP